MGATKLIIALAVLAPFTFQQQNPRPLPWPGWVDTLSYIHIINLTEYLVKDVTYKLRHAEKIQEQHKHSITFELGTIAAGVLDRFKSMMKLYRKYAEEKSFIRRDYDVWHYLYAFHTIQGDYNEIRMEQNTFLDIVREYETTKSATTKFSLPPGFTLPGWSARRLFSGESNSSLHLIEGKERVRSTTNSPRNRWLQPVRKVKAKSLWKLSP